MAIENSILEKIKLHTNFLYSLIHKAHAVWGPVEKKELFDNLFNKYRYAEEALTDTNGYNTFLFLLTLAQDSKQLTEIGIIPQHSPLLRLAHQLGDTQWAKKYIDSAPEFSLSTEDTYEHWGEMQKEFERWLSEHTLEDIVVELMPRVVRDILSSHSGDFAFRLSALSANPDNSLYRTQIQTLTIAAYSLEGESPFDVHQGLSVLAANKQFLETAGISIENCPLLSLAVSLIGEFPEYTEEQSDFFLGKIQQLADSLPKAGAVIELSEGICKLLSSQMDTFNEQLSSVRDEDNILWLKIQLIIINIRDSNPYTVYQGMMELVSQREVLEKIGMTIDNNALLALAVDLTERFPRLVESDIEVFYRALSEMVLPMEDSSSVAVDFPSHHRSMFKPLASVQEQEKQSPLVRLSEKYKESYGENMELFAKQYKEKRTQNNLFKRFFSPAGRNNRLVIVDEITKSLNKFTHDPDTNAMALLETLDKALKIIGAEWHFAGESQLAVICQELKEEIQREKMAPEGSSYNSSQGTP